MTNIQPWQPPADLDRSTKRALKGRWNDAALQSFDEQQARVITSVRNEGGAILTGELNFFIEALSQQQDRLEQESPRTAARIGHTLDQLAINGASCIGSYMRGR